MPGRYFEDFATGEVVDLGTAQLSEAEIVAFARQYDPQYFHTDPQSAKQSIYGGLIASGWHTCVVYMRLFVASVLGQAASLGSPGLEELRWLGPVRPGMLLRARYTVLETRASESRPDRGIVRGLGEMLDERGEVLMRLVSANFISRRPPAGA